jgi:serine/threonine-protein kinase
VKPERWQEIERIYNAALERSPETRPAFLEAECAGDVTLRSEVESLLGCQTEAREFLETPALDLVAQEFAEDKSVRLIGRQLGGYRVLSSLGAGGMGEVYLAEDTRLKRKVAVKLLPQIVSSDERAQRRLLQEARAAALLDHPNICTVHEICEANSHSFIVMQYVEGETLAYRIDRRPLTVSETIDVALQVADALAEAHLRGVIHRDIKPQNIMITVRGQVKVLDFGLAKMVAGRQIINSEAQTQSLVTEPGAIIGTVPYMSPEQVKGEALDARSDIFSFGAVLYEMVTGRQPFTSESAAGTISAILGQEPLPLARYAPDVPDELQRIVRKCLEKDHDLRYQSARELLIDLRHLQRGSDPVSTGAEKRTRGQHSKQWRYALAAVVLLALAAVGAVAYWLSIKSKAINSVAVLPFANVDADPDTEHLSDGITDNIIERLSQLPDLKVMSHSAIFHYKGRETDARAIGRELGVEAVLTGRLVKRGDALTISLELVDAKDNRYIWGERYDRKLSDLLTMQREIPLDVSEKLRLRIGSESKERLTREYTGNTEAYQLYLKGRYSWENWTQDGAKQAVKYFEEAIKKDPNYALAYSGLADAYMFGPGVGPDVPQKEAHRIAREAAMKALSLDAQLGEAHASLAVILLYDDWDFAGAEREFKRAIELSPSYAEGHHQYSHLLLLLGRVNESFIESKKFLELDPVSESPIGHLGYHYLYARQYDEAIQQFQKALQLYPDATDHTQLADSYYEKGMFREAVEEYLKGLAQSGFTAEKTAALREAFAKAGIKGYLQKRIEQLKAAPLKAAPQMERGHSGIAKLYARLGERDQAFEWLEKAYAERDVNLVRLKEELAFDSLRSDPRFADLLRRIGLPQ